MSTIPPPNAVGQDYLRKRKTGDPRTKEILGQAWSGIKSGVAAAKEALTPPAPPAGQAPRAFGPAGFAGLRAPASAPAPTGAAKRAAGAAEAEDASRKAVDRAPETQPDVVTPTDSTNTGAGGPRVISLPGEAGYAMVPEGHDPARDSARMPGGFAHPSARGTREPGAATGYSAEALPTEATVERGPAGATGGHSWTLRKPGEQVARYQRARYGREVAAREASEDAAIGGLEAQAAGSAAQIARSEALAEDPFAPERAQIAGRVGEAQAEARPEMNLQAMAIQLREEYNRRAAEIDSDPGLTPEERAARKQEAQQEYWMILAGIRPTARKPREDLMGPAGLPATEEAD